ncbi:MAG: hypothetical protein ACQEQC_05755 [Elusimicrobiota bacterium]
MHYKKIVFVFAFCLLFLGISEESSASGDLVEVIDTPTANALDFESYRLSFRLYGEGSIMTRLFYGIVMEDLTLGLSFNTENIIGSRTPGIQRPYLYVKFPFYVTESSWPAISVGFDEQGYGNYIGSKKGYQFSPMGFYLVLTQRGVVPGLDISAGINSDYSLYEDAQEYVKGFANVSYMLGPEFVLLSEVKDIGQWEAQLNAGAKYILSQKLNFEFSVLNLAGPEKPERILKLNYSGDF